MLTSGDEVDVLAASACTSCGDVRFPPQAICVRCSGETILTPINDGVVTAQTVTADGAIVEVRTALGVHVIGPTMGPVDFGDAVTVTRRANRWTWEATSDV